MRYHRAPGAGVNAQASIPDELFVLPDSEPWMGASACKDIDTNYEWFFPESEQDERNGKAVCAACPVAWQCLDYSIRKKEVWGIWGGMNLQERTDLARKYRGHTSSVARAAHRRFITELNRKKQRHVDRTRRVRPRR